MKKLVFVAIAGVLGMVSAVPAAAEPTRNPADYSVNFCKTTPDHDYSVLGQCISSKRTADPAGWCKELRDLGLLGNFRTQGECVRQITEEQRASK